MISDWFPSKDSSRKHAKASEPEDLVKGGSSYVLIAYRARNYAPKLRGWEGREIHDGRPLNTAQDDPHCVGE